MGSKEIFNLKFRHSFVFIGTAGGKDANEKLATKLDEHVQVSQIFHVSNYKPEEDLDPSLKRKSFAD